jgi:hypothetical protein
VTIFRLTDLIPDKSHELWWLVDAPGFDNDCLSAAAEAYLRTESLDSDPVLNNAKGMHRYGEVLSAELKVLRRRGGQSGKVHNQPRILITGPQGKQVQFAVRRGNPTSYGFETAECRDAMVQLSLLSESSFEFTEGEPSTIGALLMHRFDPDAPDYVEMWLVHQWRTEKGWKAIHCEECAYLGRLQYRGATEEPEEATGESPDDIL